MSRRNSIASVLAANNVRLNDIIAEITIDATISDNCTAKSNESMLVDALFVLVLGRRDGPRNLKDFNLLNAFSTELAR